MEALNPLCGIVCRLTFPLILSLSVIKRTLYHIVNCFSGFLNVQLDEMVIVPITCGVIDVGPRSLLGALPPCLHPNHLIQGPYHHICVIEDRVKMTLPIAIDHFLWADSYRAFFLPLIFQNISRGDREEMSKLVINRRVVQMELVESTSCLSVAMVSVPYWHCAPPCNVRE